MATFPYLVFDADNHYYEAEHSFARHIDRRMPRRAVQWIEAWGKERILVAGRLHRFISSPSFDPVARVFEDSGRELADVSGIDKVLMGSDHPLAEGLAEPRRFADELAGLSHDEIRRVMRDNPPTRVQPRSPG